MKTYSVKQIAEMLKTNPETVRRWIRDNKLNAVQLSRKTGNVITEKDLMTFMDRSPKYGAKLNISNPLKSVPPAMQIGALAGGLLAGIIFSFLNEKKSTDPRILPEDFKEYLQQSIKKNQRSIRQKRALIQQTEGEIEELSSQVDHYTYLLEHEDLLSDTLEMVTETMEEKQE